MPSRYDLARAEHEYLWQEYAPADDMTGGYVDQDDLRRLLESPTKATAAAVYENQIEYWFAIGPDVPERRLRGLDARIRDDPKLGEIAERHLCDWPPRWLD